MIKSLIQRVAHASVQPRRDRWFGSRDEQPVTRVGGGIWRTGAADGQLSVGSVYAIVAGLVAAFCFVSAFSTARDVSWRLSAPHNLWEPALWNGTSGIGIARVHRTRLINLKRIVALQWRPSGDFEVRLDTGETVFGSRRFKATVAAIADRSKTVSAFTLDQLAK